MDGWLTSWRVCTLAHGGESASEAVITATALTSAEGATSIKDEIVARMPEINNSATYRKARYMLQNELGGASAVGDELRFSGFVDSATKVLTTGEAPFNIFARLGSGAQKQDGMEKEQACLGKFQDRFLVCRNKPENDLYWDTQDAGMIGKVSMSHRHRFLTTKRLEWEWFNALVFGLVPTSRGGMGLAAAVEEVRAMKAAALTYAKHAPGWSQNVGLYFNVFGHNNVNSLFLHIIDLNFIGASFQYQAFKNCPLDDVLKVLVEEAESPSSSLAPEPRALSAAETAARGMSIAASFSGTDGATSVKAELTGRVPILKDASGFREARRLLREVLGGAQALREELTRAGLVDRGTGMLTTGTRPFNVFARIAAGEMKQKGLEADQEALGPYADKFMICGNLPENDDHWDSEDPAWVGKASMSRRHRFLTFKNLHWSWFNALVFGVVPEAEGGVSLQAALKETEEMKAAALHYAKGREGWSSNVGLFFHVFGHCSVNSLHLHIVDLNHVGPTFKRLSFKNCPLDSIIKVLSEELVSSSSTALYQQARKSAQDLVDVASKASQAMTMMASGKTPATWPAVAGREVLGDIVALSVGGSPLSVERDTLLSAPKGSVLHRLGQGDSVEGEWRHDGHGRIYLDLPPRPFTRIIDHLRVIRKKDKRDRVMPPAPFGYEMDEVFELAEVLGVQGLFADLQRSIAARWCCGRRRYRPQDVAASAA